MKNPHSQAGFSLVELLIAAGIMLVLLGLITSGISTGGKTLVKMYSQSELLEDSRYATQIISDSISRAVYVFRPGISLSLYSEDSYSVNNPNSNSPVWEIGSDPILAFIEAASDSSAGAKCSATNPAACLQFVAFYPLLRSSVVANASGPDRPFADSGNSNKWMLFEYRAYLATASLSDSSAPPTEITGGKGRILADYLMPESLSINYFACRDQDGLLEDCSSLQSVPKYRASVQTGEMQIQASMKRNKEFKTPALSFAINPRNLYSE